MASLATSCSSAALSASLSKYSPAQTGGSPMTPSIDTRVDSMTFRMTALLALSRRLSVSRGPGRVYQASGAAAGPAALLTRGSAETHRPKSTAVATDITPVGDPDRTAGGPEA